MNKLLLIFAIPLLCTSLLKADNNRMAPMTFSSYNDIQFIFKGYPILIEKISDCEMLKITYRVIQMYKGTKDTKQIVGLVSKDTDQKQQIGEKYTHLMSAEFVGAYNLPQIWSLSTSEDGSSDCLDNYTPECDKDMRAKFILEYSYKTGYVKKYYQPNSKLGTANTLEAEGYLKDGEASGLWKYYNNGEIYKEAIYEDGKKIATVQYYSGCAIDISFGNQSVEYTYTLPQLGKLSSYLKLRPFFYRQCSQLRGYHSHVQRDTRRFFARLLKLLRHQRRCRPQHCRLCRRQCRIQRR